MATIVTRAGKGSALSHNEVDANFTNLNTDKLEANTNITVADATVTGNLTVQGTTTTLNTATLQVEDKNITLNYATGDSSGSADGAGITIQDAVDSSTDATILWDATNDKFTFSHDVAATLSTAAQPNITSVGTLTGFTSTGIDDNGTSTAITIDSSENVGIGLASPEKEVEISLNSTTSTTLGQKGGLQFRSASGTVGNGGEITWASGTGNTERWCAISGHITTNTATGSVGDLVFATKGAQADTSPTEAMRIDSSGNVGIGTSSPGDYHSLSQFVVAQSGDAGITIASGASNDGRIFFADGTSGSAESEGTIRYDHSDNSMHFSTSDSVRMSIDSSGNVGVGTTSIAAEARMVVDGGRFYVNSDDQYGLLLQNAGTSGGFIGTTASNTLNFYNSSGTERMRIDSSGNVGIGETSPDSFFHIKASGVIQTIESSSTSGASTRYQNGTTSTGFYVGLRANTTGDALIYHGDNKNIEFWTNATLRGKLTNTGNFELTASQCQYVGGFGAKTTGGTLNWNDSTNARSGNGHSLMVGNATNGPGFTSYYHPFSFEYNSKDGTGNMTQFAIPYNDPANQGMWFRSRYSGTWTAWSPVSIGVATTLSGVAASGDIYVGVNAESYVRFQGSTGTKYARFYLESDEDVRFTEGGTITANGNVVAYSTAIASDAKLKDNVETLDGCLDKVCQMRGVSYTWNDQSSKEGVEDIGVIAQEMAEIYPEVVTEVEGLNGRDPHLTVDYARLTAVLINAVKELREEVKELKNGAPV